MRYFFILLFINGCAATRRDGEYARRLESTMSPWGTPSVSDKRVCDKWEGV